MKLFSIIFLLIFTVSFGQKYDKFEYYELLDHAMEFYKKKDYTNAGVYFDNAIKYQNYKVTQDNLYNAACVWSLAKQNNKSFHYLRKILHDKMIKGWNDPVELFKSLNTDQDLSNIRQDKRWKKIINKFSEKKVDFENNIDSNLAQEIKEMGMSDQSIRLKLDSIRKSKGLGSKEELAVIEEMKKTDERNLNKLQEIIQNYGWPGPKKIGYKNNQYVFLVVQHSDLLSQKKFLPLMQKAVNSGNALPKDLAYLEDRINMREMTPQKYGSQVKILNKKFVLFPLQDPDNVDRYRASVGLEALKDYLAGFNLQWNVNKYKKDQPLLKNLLKP